MLENPLRRFEREVQSHYTVSGVLSRLVVIFFPFLRRSKPVLRHIATAHLIPPGKHLHRNTFSYLNEQSATLISALSRLIHTIACNYHPSYIVYTTYIIPLKLKIRPRLILMLRWGHGLVDQ